jgi:DNA ligase-1
MELPILYSLSSTGKVKVWLIRVEGTKIITSYGYENGKMQETTTEIKAGKNKGRSNETTAEEQAQFEARSKWNKKHNEGYSEKLSNAAPTTVEAVEEKKVVSSGSKVLPMLALDYNKRGHDIKFPCYVQAKLDGVRCIYNNGILSSRLGKAFPALAHIKNELKTVGITAILDGELYSDTLGFQEIVGIVKKEKPDPAKEIQIKYVLYDIVSDKDYTERLEMLKALPKMKSITVLKTEVCKDASQVKVFHDKYVADGYEGVILRNKVGGYQIKHRSKNLQKYKEFQDAEYRITGFTEGVGNEAGLIIWECVTEQGNKFSVRPHGTREERAKLFANGSKYLGKKLTVKFQELTDDGIPRFPTTLHGGEADIRDYE